MSGRDPSSGISRGAVGLERVVWPRHQALLTVWLNSDDVKRWWLDPEARLDEVRSTPDTDHAMIMIGEEPVGYIRWELPDRDVLASVGLQDVPEGAMDADIFIGESQWRGKGLAKIVLDILIDRLLRQTEAPAVGLCTSVNNQSAIRAFEKAGFDKSIRFEAPTYGPMWFMMKTLSR